VSCGLKGIAAKDSKAPEQIIDILRQVERENSGKDGCVLDKAAPERPVR